MTDRRLTPKEMLLYWRVMLGGVVLLVVANGGATIYFLFRQNWFGAFGCALIATTQVIIMPFVRQRMAKWKQAAVTQS